ncbi:uncharacterized protein METZ01_LOCUS298202, partial [marine metagenome]
ASRRQKYASEAEIVLEEPQGSTYTEPFSDQNHPGSFSTEVGYSN